MSDPLPVPPQDLQAFLKRRGFYRAALDGIWGPFSKDALTAFLTGLPSVKPVDTAGFIVEQEGYDVPPDWPGGESGVTIFCGVDLRFTTVGELAAMQSYLPAGSYSAVKALLGRQGSHDLAMSLRQYEWTKQQAIDEFRFAEMHKIALSTGMVYPILYLPADSATALRSLVYNRGNSLRGASRSGMAALKDLASRKAYASMAQCIWGMAALWQAGGVLYRGPQIAAAMRDRRNEEGDLCLLDHYRLMASVPGAVRMNS
jgi:hypothetical protein